MTRRVVLRYSIATKIRRTKSAGVYEVVDLIAYDSGRSKAVPRFKGTRDECVKVANKIAAYWKKALAAKPPV